MRSTRWPPRRTARWCCCRATCRMRCAAPSAGRAPSGLSGLLEQTLPLALPFLLFLRLALVVLLLAAREPDLELDAPALVMKVDRHEGITRTLDAADQLVDFPGMEQELARADGIGNQVRGGRRQRADMGADEEDFAVAYDDVGFLDLRAARPDRLHLPAMQRQPRFEALLDEIIVERFSVFDDA